ncbi:uncharacterized protein LOC108679709, partial [Hyalella azteca]|uniref:Uncharacterized protein LOC108679709 n=1 Tax=Hyalella azteca TaxID=294128 RepID=A0A979FM00_HYAAZ
MSTNEVDEHVALSPLLDDAAWQPWPALGGHWMIKWTTRGDGYILVITDGIRGWIENRSSEYVEEKAQEWAACVAAAAGEVAELVLRALLSAAEGAGDHSARGCRVEVTWHSHDDILTLKLRDQLDQDMPYCWTFCLTALQHTQMQHLMIVPLAVQLQLLQVQLQHKDTQLQQLRQQLSDFTPEGTAPARLQQLQQEEITRAAAAKILKS